MALLEQRLFSHSLKAMAMQGVGEVAIGRILNLIYAPELHDIVCGVIVRTGMGQSQPAHHKDGI